MNLILPKPYFSISERKIIWWYKNKYILYVAGSSNKPLSSHEIIKKVNEDFDLIYKANENDYDFIIKGFEEARGFFKSYFKENLQKKIDEIDAEIEKECVISKEKTKHSQKITMSSIKPETNRLSELHLQKDELLSGKNSSRKYLRYSLNLRGLMLYIYLENTFSRYGLMDENEQYEHLNKIKEQKKPQSKSKRRIIKKILENKSKIEQIISNPLIIKQCPFLQDWDYHKKLNFNVIKNLSEIANEVSNQITLTLDFAKYSQRRNFIDTVHDADRILYRTVAERYILRLIRFLEEKRSTDIDKEFLNTGKNNYGFIHYKTAKDIRIVNYLNNQLSVIKELKEEEFEGFNIIHEEYSRLVEQYNLET